MYTAISIPETQLATDAIERAERLAALTHRSATRARHRPTRRLLHLRHAA